MASEQVEGKPRLAARMMKPTILQGHQLVLYSKAIHPSHMEMRARRVLRGSQYEVEAWAMKGSHAIRFDRGGLCATELVCEHDKVIPTGGIVFAHIVPGEKDVEYKFAKDMVRYYGSMQVETLVPHVYHDMYDELLDFGKDLNALMYIWTEETTPGLSLIDVQRRATEVHAQAFHLLPLTGTVVRTQSIFEILQPAAPV